MICLIGLGTPVSLPLRLIRVSGEYLIQPNGMFAAAVLFCATVGRFGKSACFLTVSRRSGLARGLGPVKKRSLYLRGRRHDGRASVAGAQLGHRVLAGPH